MADVWARVDHRRARVDAVGINISPVEIDAVPAARGRLGGSLVVDRVQALGQAGPMLCAAVSGLVERSPSP